MRNGYSKGRIAGGRARIALCAIVLTVAASAAYAQAESGSMVDTESALLSRLAQNGARNAFLDFLAADAVIFRPEPVNGPEYWRAQPENPAFAFLRTRVFSDISANGILGYTTGHWQRFKADKPTEPLGFGEYVTVWERRPSGGYQAVLDMAITHDEEPTDDKLHGWKPDDSHDPNKRGWSPADASMNFLRLGMSQARLSSAYERFSGRDVRLLIDGERPILGKKQVVAAMNRYISIEFPKKVAMFQAADLAYTWNPCKFANSQEGVENGNCLHIWKLRDKKWWIILGVFSRYPNETQPRIAAPPGKRRKN